MALDKNRRLGRGLEALLGGPGAVGIAADEVGERGPLRQIPVAEIRPNPFQPRKEFPEGELAELEESLRTSGLLQPITVRPAPKGTGYELIAGERRLRAAARIGWTEIPAIVKELDDRSLLTLALVENLQRADLNPVEEAEGYQRLMEEFGLTQQHVAAAVGKDRSTVANILRLLNLPASVRHMLRDGRLSLGHARALLSVGNEHAIAELAKRVASAGLSVREVERLVRLQNGKPQSAKTGKAGPRAGSPEARQIEDRIRRYLQTDVQLSLTSAERGDIRIQFYSAEDLERILDLILGGRGDA
jgi:ParB family chromosome partitioning protein